MSIFFFGNKEYETMSSKVSCRYTTPVSGGIAVFHDLVYENSQKLMNTIATTR